MENTRDLSCGKTYRERFQAIRGETSTRSSKRSAPSPKIPYISLNLKQTEKQEDLLGKTQERSWETDGRLDGVSSTPNTGECPRDVVESSLSSILEANAPEKYYLSARACLGILNRAEKRGKALPPMLWDALIEVVELDA